MRYILLLCGAIMFGLGVRAARRLHTPEIKWYALALLSGGIAIAVWPPENALYFDHAIGVLGIGRLLMCICAAISMLAQYAMITELSDQWSSRRRIALVVGVIAMMVLFPLWDLARHAAGRDIARLLYGGYFSHPPALLAWNVAAGVAISLASALTLYALWSVPLEFPGQHARRLLHGDRYVSLGSFIPYTIGVLYGLLQVAQVVVARINGDETSLFVASNYLFMGGSVIAVVSAATVVTAVIGRRVRRLGSRAMEHDILEGQADVALLRVVVFDLIVHLRYSVEPRIIHVLKTRCQTYATMGAVTGTDAAGQRVMRRWWDLRRRRRELWQGRAALIELSVGLYTQVVSLLAYADPTLAQSVGQRCRRLTLSADHLRMVEHAAWLIAYGRAMRIEQPWKDTNLITAHLVDRAVARDALRKVRQSVYFYADTYLVVALVLDLELVSASPISGHEPQRWHYTLATQIAQALTMHDQSLGQPVERLGDERSIGA